MTARQPRDVTPTCPDCGWQGRPTTAGLAAHAVRLHSCERWRRILASRARGEAIRAAVDRTPKPCLHKHARHEHGSRNCYVLDGCRCEPCSAASVAYERARIRAHAYGRFDRLVDAEPVRAHVRELMAGGIGWKRIAGLAGVSTSTVSKLIYGHAKRGQRPTMRVRPDVADKLLAVRLDPGLLAAGVVVDPTGPARRLQALATIGWSVAALAERSGIDRQRLDHALTGRGVKADTARRVAAVYDELWDHPPAEDTIGQRMSAAKARARAARNGWLPPMAWDDETIDDPNGRPDMGTADAMVCPVEVDPIAVERACEGDRTITLSIAERVEAVLHLHALGLTDSQIAGRLGVADRTVLRIRHDRLHLPAVPHPNTSRREERSA